MASISNSVRAGDIQKKSSQSWLTQMTPQSGNILDATRDLLHRVESEAKTISLLLNSSKKEFMHLNPTTKEPLHVLDGSNKEKVDDFLCLGGYTNTTHDMDTRLGKGWVEINSLSKVWLSSITRSTKMRIFKASVESILLYSSESWTLKKSLTKKIVPTPGCCERYKKYLGRNTLLPSHSIEHTHASRW